MNKCEKEISTEQKCVFKKEIPAKKEEQHVNLSAGIKKWSKGLELTGTVFGFI